MSVATALKFPRPVIPDFDQRSGSTDNMYRLDGTFEGVHPAAPAARLPLADAPENEPPLQQDWSHLIDLMQTRFDECREIKSQAEEQDRRVSELLDRVRDDIRSARERVAAAEAYAQDVETQAEVRIKALEERAAAAQAYAMDVQKRAEALVKAAEERAAAAEQRARSAETWLSRVYETISGECSAKPPAAPAA
jgi:lysyl-tRNA synthetase class I